MRFVLLLLVTVGTAWAKETTYRSALTDPLWDEVFTAGGIHVGSGRAKRFVELSDAEPNMPHQACVLPSGKMGHCRHLRHCIQDDYRHDFIKFMDYLCIINRSSVGACCPDNVFPGESLSTRGGDWPGLAGDLPATASEDEDNVLSVSTTETRGCGLSTRAGWRMSGARQANPRDWPWMAYVTFDFTEHYCGGVLITDRHVLTAAHCTRNYKAEELFVRLGEYDTDRTDDSRSYDFRVVEKVQHELFDSMNLQNDIAILKIHRPVVFNTYVWPICLPPQNLDLVNETVIVTGWGTQWYGGPFSPVLMEVQIPVWAHDRCIESFAEPVFNEGICAGEYVGGGKDSCQGDSGGPLMYQMRSGRWVTVGIVSWGVRCGEPSHPGIYTRVDKYLAWITQNTRY